ncbi:MAG TPA: 2-C-methyl-D-erythritol 4-phosphate cytidylyltransferase [Pyrinomonadaceae bacterium]
MNVAIIAAAGHGTRMAGKRPKQFLELAGVPIIIHTLKAFEQCEAINEIIMVLSAEEVPGFLALADKYDSRKIGAVVAGGATRAASVLHGLKAAEAKSPELVAVHDGARPFVTPDEISRTVAAARLQGAAILVSAPVDTIKEVRDGNVVRTVKRGNLRNALTPQCFRYTLLRKAYEDVDVSDPDLTDESSLVERLGARIAVVEGSARNIKITRPEDLAVGEALVREMNLAL